jgi:tetratricopeptide (TPR) repeat protein
VAQPHFLRGVLYLHSFEYDDAAAAFREAQRVDPQFAMAFWGEAMTHTHPVWNQQDLALARAVLSRLGTTPEVRKAKAPTPREKAWLGAVETLYGEGSKPARDTAYAFAMEALARDHPEDAEAQAFFALALLGLNQAVRDVPTYMRAGAIAEALFQAHPDHPGAAHYVIHAFDDPEHAPLGLRAARAYSRIAPDAAHAQHMTTHIFLALGMWNDVIAQNAIAVHHTSNAPGHYPLWLGYGLLQAGRWREAATHLEHSRDAVRGEGNAGQRAYLVFMRAHHVIVTGRWDDSSLGWKVALPPALLTARAADLFVQGYSAIERGDRAAAGERAGQLRQVAGEATERGTTPNERAAAGILATELDAMLMLADGKTEEGLTALRDATRREDALPVEFGPPDIVKPSHELLGEALLELGRAAEAQREFGRALELAPRRAPSLLGLARAASRAGDRAAAERAAATLREIWQGADPEVLTLVEAKP